MKNKFKLLPKGWVETTIENICTSPQYGYTTKAVKKGDIKLLRTTDITSGKINWETVPYCLKNPENPEKYFLKEGDIVISRAGSIGISYLIIKPEKAVFASYLIRFNPLINKKHFKYFLESPIYWSNISEKKLGIAVQNVNATKLKSIKLPIPPLPEQHRIVAKVEELFSELDNGIGNLKKALEQLKTYRQAVLKYAFEGKLTKEWRTLQKRAGNPPEPAEKLLEQIKTEREKHYQKQLEDWKKACEQAKTEGKKKPAKPKKPKELPPLTGKELAELPELPEGWCRTKIGDISNVSMGQSPPGESYNTDGSGTPLINGPVEFGTTPFSKTILSKWTTKPSKICQKGDLVLCVRGSTTGRMNIAGFKACLGRGVCSIRSFSEQYFLNYYIDFNRMNIFNLGKGSTFPNISYDQITNIYFPLCSKEEQQAIVSEIESRLSVCDKIEQTIEDSLKKAEAMRQSILKKAFSGELTKDWREKHPELIAGENSAEKLLEKINAEKAISAASRKKPRSKKTKKR